MTRRKHLRRGTPRFGLTYLEVQVAFLLLGVGLSGLVPLAVMQSKHLERIEDRFDHQTTYYLDPSDSAWARKLGVPASVVTTPPSPPPHPANNRRGGSSKARP